MENKELKILKDFKNKYKDLLEIKYIVGSFARRDFNKNSDIDIIYSLKNEALKKDAFEVINKIVSIKKELQTKLNRKVDFIDESSLNNIAKKYMKEKIDV